jgi:hypothetical protein
MREDGNGGIVSRDPTSKLQGLSLTGLAKVKMELKAYDTYIY